MLLSATATSQVTGILTHIENEGAQIRHTQPPVGEVAAWREPLLAIAQGFPEVLDCHQLTLLGSGGHVSVSCDCVFRGELPIARVHEITSQTEYRFRQAYPALYRVTIHPEPNTEIE